MNSKDFALGILSTTAVILLVGIFVIHSRPQPAYASGMTDRAGRYVMTVGSVTINDEELVFVIDTNAKKMISYRFDTRQRKAHIVSGVDLASLSDGAGQSKTGGKKKKSKKRRP